jgi:hypothetical protein
MDASGPATSVLLLRWGKDFPQERDIAAHESSFQEETDEGFAVV